MMQRDDLRTELFSEENIHAAAELAKRCFSSPWSEEIYRRELENPQSVGFVCMCGERAVGMIHCNFVLDELTLNTLCVDAAFRRQGIARALFANVREMMHLNLPEPPLSAGCCLFLRASPRGNSLYPHCLYSCTIHSTVQIRRCCTEAIHRDISGRR